MNLFIEELTGGLPEWRETARVVIRLVAASVVGAVIGLQREHAGKPAGLRTHMLVSLGAALLVIAPVQLDFDSADLSRIIQGVCAGIGFIGGGAILKGSTERDVHGLTTAAGIWLTAALGVAAGLGAVGLALISATLAWVILAVVLRIEGRASEGHSSGEEL